MNNNRVQAEDSLNPYIAFTDVGINLILILVFFVAAVLTIGRAGWERIRYKEPMEQFKRIVQRKMPASACPTPLEPEERNDPPGAQRWVFAGRTLFYPNTARLTPGGASSLVTFAKILSQHRDKWRRVRIEGHTVPPIPGQRDNWELSAQRAAVVARVFHAEGRIPSYFLAVSGRAGQAPIDKANRQNPANERVEIVIEFSLMSAEGKKLQ
jgi:chemotaxis protein MotB